MPEIYLDDAATTKPLPEVVGIVDEYLTRKWYNPSAKYPPAESVKNEIDKARRTVADFIGCSPHEIFFTSGASESNSMAIRGYLDKNNRTEPLLVTSGIEHKSIMKIAELYKPNSVLLSVAKSTGLVGIDELVLSTVKAGSIVSIQWANNEIGCIQNIEHIAELCKKRGHVFHTDATQAFPHIKLNMSENQIDMMSVSGHKFGAPKGCGFLYVRESCRDMIEPLICGVQEDEMRGGTENVPYIMGLSKAIELLKPTNDCPVAEYFEQQLVDKLGCVINGGANKLKHIISCTFQEPIVGEYLVRRLGAMGIYASVGSACNSYSQTPSTVLDAIGLTHDEISRTVRFSLSDDISTQDIDYVVKVIVEICGMFDM